MLDDAWRMIYTIWYEWFWCVWLALRTPTNYLPDPKPDSKAMKREAPGEQQFQKNLNQQLYAETFNITFETQETFTLMGQYPFNTRNQSIHTKLHTSAELNGRKWVSTLLLLLTHIALPTLTDKMKRISEQPQNEQCKLEKPTPKANCPSLLFRNRYPAQVLCRNLYSTICSIFSETFEVIY